MKTKHPAVILARRVLRARQVVNESLKIVNSGRLLCLRHIRAASCEASKVKQFTFTIRFFPCGFEHDFRPAFVRLAPAGLAAVTTECFVLFLFGIGIIIEMFSQKISKSAIL